MTTTSHTQLEELDRPSQVLVFARRRRAEADRAEADVLVAGVTWAEQHPPESIHVAAFWIGGGEGVSRSPGGVPRWWRSSVSRSFAAALGRPTTPGKLLIAHGLELKYRLPRTWGRVMSGDLQAWRARRIAEATLLLSPEAAAYVDAQVAPFAHKIGIAQLDRLVQEAMDRFMPEVAKEKAEQAADGRHVKFHHDQVSFNGTTRIEGELDLADALDLDAALSAEAEQLALAGSNESLDVRRAMAVGEIARQQLALDLLAAAGREVSTASTNGRVVKPRRVVLYVHLSEAALRGARAPLGAGREHSHRCHGQPGQDLVRQPGHRGGGEARDRPERAHPRQRLPGAEAARGADQPQGRHVRVPLVQPTSEEVRLRALRPPDDDGPTCGCNIGPMCRRHHRVKTHSTWSYTTVDVTANRPPPKPEAAQHFY
ncbi:MAG: endonuclease [Marmoricola sp.]|jgi:hypothetical protein|nr:endonuclease [Marmoricola sp.]